MELSSGCLIILTYFEQTKFDTSFIYLTQINESLVRVKIKYYIQLLLNYMIKRELLLNNLWKGNDNLKKMCVWKAQ